MTLQDEIDAIDYPPTHTYQLRGLVPTGQLAARVKIIEEEFPRFFKEGTLLDVGCNKGFFSLYHKGCYVEGIDPSEDCIRVCRKLKTVACNFYKETFGELSIKDGLVFDRIFIGNGHHYPFIEAGGWGWVEKLGNLCYEGGEVLLEGPTDMDSRDAQNCIPEELAPEFNQARMLEVFDSLFTLEKIVPSPLSQRYFLLFKKRSPSDIYQKYLKSIYRLVAGYTSKTDVVMEIGVRHDRGILGRKIIPHSEYIMVDKNPRRPGLIIDAVTELLPRCDVAISTAVFHHTPPEDIETLFVNLTKHTKRAIIISGPADDMGVPLYGDHKYHLNHKELDKISKRAGWWLVFNKRIGLEALIPYESFFVFVRGDGT